MGQQNAWKPGRGKLGLLDPLLGTWIATEDSPVGPVRCTRTYAKALNGWYVILDATWDLGTRKYSEHAVIGLNDEGLVSFWSFTSDGKRSLGTLTDAKDVHPSAIAFVAEMPAGQARMIYWPADGVGFNWAVESKTRKGWSRFTQHHYVPLVIPEP